jgi:CubicO group peptidase (beta-lactamase class C family)
VKGDQLRCVPINLSGAQLSRIVAFLIALTLGSPFARAADAQSLPRQLRDSIESWRKRNPATGLAVGVLRRGARILAEGYGTRRAGFDSAVTASTVFHMASVSKQFTATAVMQLVEEGKVDLNARVTRYLPSFRMKDHRADQITVKQLLNHTSGLPDVTNYQWNHPEYDDGALDRFVRGLADSMLIAGPGERFSYSNIGFEVAADLVATVSGLAFEDYIQKRILTPLTMRHSTFLMTDVDSANLAWPHVRRSTGAVQSLDYYTYNRAHAGSGTLHSSVDDMLRWAEANLRRGELNGVRFARATTVNQLWTSTVDRSEDNIIQAYLNATPSPFDSIGYSLGWRWYRFAGRHLVGHSGQDDGFRSHILISPDESIAVVVMMNDYTGDAADLARILYRLASSRGNQAKH